MPIAENKYNDSCKCNCDTIIGVVVTITVLTMSISWVVWVVLYR